MTGTIIGGIAVPVSPSRIKSTLLNLVEIQNRTFLIVNSNNYYSMGAIELKKESEIRIFKDASTKKLEIKAFNHFSTGDLTNLVTDNTLKLFMVILSTIVLVALLIGFVMKLVKKLSKKDKKHTTFDAIDGAIIQENLKDSVANFNYRDGSDSLYSDQSDFKYGLENPNDFSEIFPSREEINRMSGKSNASRNRRDDKYGRVNSSQRQAEDEEEEEKLA